MRLVRLYMTVSLDGYVAGPRDGMDVPLGIGIPVFVLTHAVPDNPPPGGFRYVTDVHECAAGPAGAGPTAVRRPTSGAHRTQPGPLSDRFGAEEPAQHVTPLCYRVRRP